MSRTDDLLRTAEEVLAVLARHRLDAVVIGAVALAAARSRRAETGSDRKR